MHVNPCGGGIMSPEFNRIAELFMPDTLEGVRRYQATGSLFVHYTTAEAAMSIFESQRVWLRNAMTMNDFSEIEHGKSCLFPAYQNDAIGGRLRRLLDSIEPGLRENLEDIFNSWLPHFEQDTYLISLSEHGPGEDEFGRLSMWRAYGRRNGVALVLRSTPFMAETDMLKAYSAPVSYRSAVEFEQYFLSIIQNLEQNKSELVAMGPDALTSCLFMLLRNSLLCSKHPGFKEELEWRVIHSPTVEASEIIEPDFATIEGVPQQIYKVPLLDRPDLGLHGADLNSLLDKVIVGPSSQPLTIRKALVARLAQRGVENAEDRVVVSEIPLRT
jgi:hypothetical protein